MSFPTVFANLAAGNQPASLLDTMFNVAGQQGNIPCTATGTNAITLTPSTNYYLPAAYTIAQIASFKAAATSSGSVTLQIGGLSLLKLFTAAGVQCASGDIVSGTHYSIQYWADLDSGNGGFIILNATVTAIANPVSGTFKNLKLITTSDTTLTPTADAIVLQNSGGGTVRLTSVAPAVTSTASVGTANGIISAVANSTFYSFWFIYNPNAALSSTNPGGWLDTSATSPTLPSGYTYSARFGWFVTNSTGLLMRIVQFGPDVQYVVGASGSTTGNVPVIASATAGTYSVTSPTLATASVASVVPSTAAKIRLLALNDINNAGTASILVAPNVNFGGTNRGPQGSAAVPWPIYNSIATTMGMAEFVLETTAVFWACSGSAGSINCLGWTDRLP